MSRDADISIFTHEKNSAGGDLDIKATYFKCTRPILVTGVVFIGENPSDTDTDTTAVDVDYDTDGAGLFTSEICSLAATEYNDTTPTVATFGASGVGVTIPLTTAALAANPVGVRVPAGRSVRVLSTDVGAGADTRYMVQVEYIVL